MYFHHQPAPSRFQGHYFLDGWGLQGSSTALESWILSVLGVECGVLPVLESPEDTSTEGVEKQGTCWRWCRGLSWKHGPRVPLSLSSAVLLQRVGVAAPGGPGWGETT